MSTEVSTLASQVDQLPIEEGVTSCRICHVLAEAPQEPWDRPVRETLNFVVLPSLGSLVPGWLLVFPRAHYRALADCREDQREELRYLRLELDGLLSNTFSSPVAQFEHGAVCGGVVGCGVFHAHLHLVPTAYDLLGAGRALFPDLVWHEAPNLDSVWETDHPEDYLCIEQEGRTSVSTSDGIPSQFFRRALSAAMERPHEWNWRLNPGLDMIERTTKTLSVS